MRTFSGDFEVAGRRVCPRLNRVVEGDVIHQVEPRVMKVLVHLAANAGRVCPRQEILDGVWGETAVSEDSLTRAVADLRKLFGDRASDPRVIETIRQVGYRLIVPVAPVQGVEKLREQGGESPQVVDSMGDDEVPGAPLTASPERREKVPGASFSGPSSEAGKGAGARRLVPAGLGAGLLIALLLAVPQWRAHQRAQRDGAPPLRPTPLTSLPGLELAPALSPDGSRVVYAYTDLAPGGGLVLMLQDVAGGEAERLIPAGAAEPSATEASPAWAPDGSAVAFVRRSPREPGPGRCGIYFRSLPGGEEGRIASCRAPMGRALAWAPKGSPLAGMVISDGSGSAWHLLWRPLRAWGEGEGAASDLLPLTAPPPGRRDLFPAVSPDGSALAFARGLRTTGIAPALGGVVGEVYVVDAAAARDAALAGEPEVGAGPGAVRAVTPAGWEISGVAWSADGASLLVTASATGVDFGVYRVSSRAAARAGTADAATDWLVGGRDVLRHPSTDLRGGLVYEQWDSDADIWRVEIGETSRTTPARAARWITSTRMDFAPSLGAGSEALAFVSTRGGPLEIWQGDARGPRVRQLTRLGHAYVSAPRFSPDGGWLVFETRRRGSGGTEIWAMRADGGRPHPLQSRPADGAEGAAYEDRLPRWSRDGRALYFTSDRDGSWQLYRLPVAPREGSLSAVGPPRRLTRGGGFRSAEGEWEGRPVLFHDRPSEPGLWALPLDGGLGGGPAFRVWADLAAPGDRGLGAGWEVRGATLFELRAAGPTPAEEAPGTASGEASGTLRAPAGEVPGTPPGGARPHFAPSEISTRLVAVDLASGDASTVALLPGSLIQGLPSLAVSEDGGVAFVALQRGLTGDLMRAVLADG